MSRVTVATYPTRAEAQTVAHMLADAGLDAVAVGDDAGGALPHLTVGLGGSTVTVAAGQEDRAASLLDVDLRDPHEQSSADPVLDRRAVRRRRWLQIIAAAAMAVIVAVIAISAFVS